VGQVPGVAPRHHENMRHVTKWAEPLTAGRSVPDVLRRAFFQLRNGRPGR